MYWEAKTLKGRAKNVLRDHYWEYLLAVVVCGLVIGYSLQVTVNINIKGQNFRTLRDFVIYLIAYIQKYYPTIIGSVALSSAGKTLWRIFAANPIEVGSCRYRTLATYGRFDFQNIFYSFSSGRYIKIVITMFLKSLYQFLWGLLLVIPAIIKGYSYFMVPYIMAENPEISYDRAFEISKAVTKGEKWRMFLLDLSFLGWYMLGALCLGVGVFFVMPYHYSTLAELYGALRFKAVRSGVVNPSEIGAELF